MIELMIAITIGVLVALAAMNAYIGASEASKIAEAQARMHEDGQMALNILTQQLRVAGSNPAQPNRAAASSRNPLNILIYPLRGCDVTFTDIGTAATTSALGCNNPASTTQSGSFAVGYEAVPFDTIAATAGGNPTDCVGGTLTGVATTVTAGDNSSTTTTVFQAFNVYYVGSGTDNPMPSLYCKGSSSAAAPVVENVDALKLTYGVSLPSNTAAVAGYISAYDLENSGTLAGATDPYDGTVGGLRARWALARTIRVCVVIRSSDPVAPTPASSQYFDCAGNLVTSVTDRRLRHAFTTTVELRNL